MCASAVIWAGISTLVYGVSINSLKSKGIEQIDIGCRDILKQANRKIEIIGPRLENEAIEVFTQTF